jgi:hypothetical protein
MPTPTPTPDGFLPTLLAQLDLGVPAGNAYGPSMVVVDKDGVAYVACERCDACTEGQAAISVVDLRKGRVVDVWPLPGRVPGPLTVGGGLLYVNYDDAAYRERLAVLDTTTGQVRRDVGIEYVRAQDRLWLDGVRGRLYLPYGERIEVRDSRTLEAVGSLDYATRSADRHVVGDMQADRLYVSLDNTLYAYRASDMALLWQLQAPADTIGDLALDAARAALLVRAAPRDLLTSAAQLCVVTLDGQIASVATPVGPGPDWRLAWADLGAGRIVLQDYLWPQGAHSLLRLSTVDTAGNALGQPLVLAGWAVADRVPGESALFVLRRDAHTLALVDGASLSVISQLQLGVELSDLAVEDATQRLFVNDTAGRLYEISAGNLDGGALTLGRTILAGSGDVLLDESGGSLLVAQAATDPTGVSVVGLADLSVGQVITGGNRVALDTKRGRALVGYQAAAYPQAAGEVQVWDLVSGSRVGALPQAGSPAYSPVRDEYYVAGYTCHVYSAETLAEQGSLTPDIDAQQCRGCTGQPAVWQAQVFVDRNALALEVSLSGKGGGISPMLRTFALDTLRPITHALTFLSTADGDYLALAPTQGVVYQNAHFSYYVSRANLVVWRASSDERLAWRDGLSFDLISPDGAVGLAERDGRWLAIDTRTMTPLGYTPRYGVHTYDQRRELYYCLQGSRLVVLRTRGGWPETSPGPLSARLGAHVRSVVCSPDYAADRTLFAVTDRALYRSRDGGAGWELLRGGLPQLQWAGDSGIVVAVSPDYAHDRTVFAGGWDAGSRGLGVWRSTDGGDSWLPMWDGLAHLRVERLAISPDYARDGAVAAYCQFADLLGAGWGQSVFVSSDRGEHWALNAQTTDSYNAPLPRVEALFGAVTAPEPLLPGVGYAGVGRGNGDAYVQLLTFPDGESLVAQAFSSGYPGDQTIYVLSSYHLYRSTDNGVAWQQAKGTLFGERTYERRFTVLTVTSDAQRGALLILADDAGELDVLAAAGLEWVAA